MCSMNKKCACTNLLDIYEAITLIVLSLIYPEKSSLYKPIIRRLDGSEKQSNQAVEIDYQQPLDYFTLSSILFNVNFSILCSIIYY